ncbi:cadherin-like domain-containing protein, partial [uncultured Prochlorococcus sp.]|uniref:cadherin-like domain-containing protein n=1 Tax=uncultured Prochlorococcus sp. TaxID=159733 RepID=UPI00258CED84
DVEDDFLRVTNLKVEKGQGNIIDNNDGTYTFNPNQNWNGKVRLVYDIEDNNGGTLVAKAKFVVKPINDAPVVTGNVSYGDIMQNEQLIITNKDEIDLLLSKSYDIEDDFLKVENIKIIEGNGTRTREDGDIYSFTPSLDWYGILKISYEVVDIHGARSNAYAFININEKTVSDVLPTDSNVGEIQSGESILITEDQLLSNSSLDNEEIKVSNLTLSHGEGSLIYNNDKTWTFNQSSNWEGNVTFTYKISEKEVLSNSKNHQLGEYRYNNTYNLNEISDFDGNLHGGLLEAKNDYKYQGALDVNADGDIEAVFTNRLSGRWVTAEIDETTGKPRYNENGEGGITRIVGIYNDPLVLTGEVEKGSDHDSQKRFMNDLINDNLNLKASSDFDGDGFQEVYWKTNDGSAYLRALMHADGNIQYANYQNESQMKEYLITSGYDEHINEII